MTKLRSLLLLVTFCQFKKQRSEYQQLHRYTGYRGESRAAATSKMERFVIIVNGWKPLDAAEALDPPLMFLALSVLEIMFGSLVAL